LSAMPRKCASKPCTSGALFNCAVLKRNPVSSVQASQVVCVDGTHIVHGKKNHSASPECVFNRITLRIEAVCTVHRSVQRDSVEVLQSSTVQSWSAIMYRFLSRSASHLDVQVNEQCASRVHRT